MIRAHFNDIEAAIVQSLHHCDEAHVCSAWISSRPILDALSVCESKLLVTNQRKYIQGSSEYSDHEYNLILQSVSEFYMSRKLSQSLMHNKYIVLLNDGEPYEIWTGSYNFTSAAVNNDENAIRITSAEIARDYEKNFQTLLGGSIRLT